MTKEQSLKSIIYVILYRVLLDYYYINNIFPLHSYAGIKYIKNSENYILSWLILLFILVIYYFIIETKTTYKPSTIIILGIFNISFVSGTTIIAYTGIEIKYTLAYFIYWLNLIVVGLVLQKVKDYNYKSYINYESRIKIFNLLVFIFISVILIVSFKYRRLSINLKLSEQNILRLNSRNFSYPFGISYILNWSTILLPFLMVMEIRKHRYLNSVAILIISLLLYSIDGKKGVLFNIIVSTIVPFFYKNKLIRSVPIFICIILVISIIEEYVLGTKVVNSIFLYRLIILPSHLNTNYFDFFSKNEFDYLRQSILRYFGFKSTYDIPIGYLIGSKYDYYDINVNSNNGLFGDAFMNFGYWGIIILPLLFLTVLYIFNNLTKKSNEKSKIIFLIPMITSFVNGPFFVVLLTSGFIISIIFLRLKSEKLTL